MELLNRLAECQVILIINLLVSGNEARFEYLKEMIVSHIFYKLYILRIIVLRKYVSINWDIFLELRVELQLIAVILGKTHEQNSKMLNRKVLSLFWFIITELKYSAGHNFQKKWKIIILILDY
jgi:hypothetical protein